MYDVNSIFISWGFLVKDPASSVVACSTSLRVSGTEQLGIRACQKTGVVPILGQSIVEPVG